MVIVVHNDAAYGAEVHHFEGQPLDLVRFPTPTSPRSRAGSAARA
jgi:hypothetical protein